MVYGILLSMQVHIHKACWRCKPLERYSLFIVWKQESKSFYVAKGSAQTSPLYHAINFVWEETPNYGRGTEWILEARPGLPMYTPLRDIKHWPGRCGRAGGDVLGEYVHPSSLEDHCWAETGTGLSSPSLEVDQPVLVLCHLLETSLWKHVLFNVLHRCDLENILALCNVYIHVCNTTGMIVQMYMKI